MTERQKHLNTDRKHRWRRAVSRGVLTGAATLIPLWRIPRGPLLGWTGGVVAVTAAAGSALAMDRKRREAEVEGAGGPVRSPAWRIVAPLAVGATAGTAAAAGMWINTVTDRWAERGIARLGIGRPRLVYAGLAAVLAAAIESREEPARERSAPSAGKA